MRSGTSRGSRSPEPSRPYHIARTPRKMVGRRAWTVWLMSGAPHFSAYALKTRRA
ncbi:MAG: hypothetical protein ACJ754_15680 [Pyrinomonadaceae bacterium]